MATTSNKLIPIVAAVGMTIVGVVLYKQFAGDGSVKAGAEMTAVPTPQLPKTDGADNDTPIETLRTVTTSNAELRSEVEEVVIRPVLDRLELDTSVVKTLINPTGIFVIGGPQGDAGLTGRKIIIDTYGGAARHGGGAFSGKDPSKVDRSAAYAMRWVAKNVVAAGLARRCEVQVAYAIGKAAPVGFYVETFGTGTVSDLAITHAIREVFDLRPGAIIRDLDLLRPIYHETARYGHFGRELPHFTWEKTDRVDALRSAVQG